MPTPFHWGPPQPEVRADDPNPTEQRFRSGRTRAEHRRLAEQITLAAKQDPARYRRYMVSLVAKGYMYLLGSLFLVLILLALFAVLAAAAGGTASFIVKLAAPLLVIAIGMVRSAWVRFPQLAGHVVSPREAPALWDMIENLRRRAGAPRIHRVYLTSDLGAAVCERPTLGPIGWSRPHLILGLPLLMGFSTDEVSSVLAHEFGHLSRSHSRFNAWIYRLRSSWLSLSPQLQNQPRSLGFFRSRFLAFLPQFDAGAFILARCNEYEADRMSAELVGSRTTALALARHAVLDRMLQERFWRSIGALNSETGRAPVDIDTRMATALRAGVDETTAQAWLEDALPRPTDVEDMHPSLTDRLHGLGVLVSGSDVAGPVSETAADRLLGAEFLAALHAERSKAWHDDLSDAWRSEYEQREGLRRTYVDLKEQAQQGSLPMEARDRYRTLVYKHEGLEAAIRFVRHEVEAYPDRDHAHLYLGMMLLELQDEQGLEEIGLVAEREPALAVEECRRAYDWLFVRGRVTEADAWYDAWSRCTAWREHGNEERSLVNLDDEFLPASLPEDLVRTVRKAVGCVRGIRAAWFVQKKVTVLPSEVCQILFLWPHRAFYQDAQTQSRDILTRLQRDLPAGHWKMVVLPPKLKPLMKKFDAIPGARLV